MQKILPLMLLFFPLLFFGQSASDDMPAETVLENEMTAPEIGHQQLALFDNRAKQKLEDFADVLTLLSDAKTEMELRTQIALSAFGFFQNNKCEIEWRDLHSGKTIAMPLDVFLEKTKKEEKGISVRFLKINGQPPDNCPPPICSWKLDFQIEQKDMSGKSTFTPASMKVLLEKRKKYFGKINKEVWEVFLGEITIADGPP